MISTTATVNEQVILHFQTTPGYGNSLTSIVINNGIKIDNARAIVTETAISGIYIISFTPNATGRTVIIVNGQLVAHVEVVSKSIYSFLKNLEDEAMGSWVWDKRVGTLNMTRQDGTPLANFDVVENLNTASRERVS